jgi:hypothetical protein
MAGIFLRHQGALVPLMEAPYENEALLQKLVAQHPETLEGDRDTGSLLLIRREAAVYDEAEVNTHGSLDHLFLDGEGVAVLVEVKRSTDSRIRREVVGQMLDYAAGAANWKVEQLQTWLAERCAADQVDIDRVIGDHTDDPEAFWENVRLNLGARRMRLVFVADVIPRTLQAIVEFLNEQMTECEVIAIEIKQYLDADGRQTIIVPRVVGQTEKAKEAKGNRTIRRWDRASFMEDLARKQPADIVTAVHAILDWAHARGDLVWRFGHGGTDASLQVGVHDEERRIFPFVIYSNGWLELPFVRMASYPPFDDHGLRQQYVDRLAAIASMNLGSDSVARRPNLPLSALSDAPAREQFLAAVDWALGQGVHG